MRLLIISQVGYLIYRFTGWCLPKYFTEQAFILSDGHQMVIAVAVKVLPVLWKSTGKQLCDWINTFLLSLRTQSLALDHIELNKFIL